MHYLYGLFSHLQIGLSTTELVSSFCTPDASLLADDEVCRHFHLVLISLPSG